jgi:hypothetical protein
MFVLPELLTTWLLSGCGDGHRFFSWQQSADFVNAPSVASDSGFRRWRDAQSLIDAPKTVVRGMAAIM